MGGRGGGGDSVKKRHVFNHFFGDTDSVSLFIQFEQYNNATFEKYIAQFSSQNIEN